MSRRTAVVALNVVIQCLLLLFVRGNSAGQERRFSDSTHLMARIVKNNGHILWVAPRPGSEDVKTISYLRAVRGFKVSFLYATNGESLPVLGEEWSARTISSRRKEEALQFGTQFGSVRFLNKADRPDDGDPWSPEDIENAAKVIRELKPTILVIGSDPYWQIDRPECSLALKDGLKAAILLAADGKFSPSGQKFLKTPWMVETLVSNRREGTGWRSPGDDQAKGIISDWRDSYTSMVWDASSTMGSCIYVRDSGSIKGELWTLPSVRSARLRTLEKIIKSSCEAVLANRKDALQQISTGLDSISALFREGAEGFSSWDQRILVQWKGGLDRLKRLLLGHNVQIEISEHLLTDRQLAFVVVTGVHELAKRGTVQLMYQLEEGDSWIIQETTKRLFTLKGDTMMTIISPAKNEYGYPIETFGLNLPSLRFPLRTSILYNAAGVRQNSFIETQESNIGFAPRHAGVILNPDVHMESNEPLVVRSWNYSRDPVSGSYIVNDSNCTGWSRSFRTGGKNSSKVDSVWVSWKRSEPGGVTNSELISGKKVVEKFRGHSFIVRVREDLRIGVIGTPHRALERAVRRFPLSFSPVLISPETIEIDDTLDAIIIDAEYRPTGGVVNALTSWIERGGRMILCNAPTASALMRIGNDSLFATTIPTIAARDSLVFGSMFSQDESLHRRETRPAQWPALRARQALSWSNGFDPDVLIQSAKGDPLAVRMRVGKGDVFVTTLNVSPVLQAMNVQAHELLAYFLGTK